MKVVEAKVLRRERHNTKQEETTGSTTRDERQETPVHLQEVTPGFRPFPQIYIYIHKSIHT